MKLIDLDIVDIINLKEHINILDSLVDSLLVLSKVEDVDCDTIIEYLGLIDSVRRSAALEIFEAVDNKLKEGTGDGDV